MKYIIYLAVGVLAVWAVWYVIRHVRRQLRELLRLQKKLHKRRAKFLPKIIGATT